MKKKRKPLEERSAEDYREAADDSLELAKVLAGQGTMSDQDFLERMARSDDLVDHDLGVSVELGGAIQGYRGDSALFRVDDLVKFHVNSILE